MRKQLILTKILLSSFLYTYGQPTIFDSLTENAYILSEGTLHSGNDIEKFTSHFEKTNPSSSYQQTFSIDVNQNLSYEIGELQTEKSLYSVMLVKRKDNAQIEFLTIYKNEDPSSQTALLDSRRKDWMENCNAHNADKLVKELYTSNAYYYNRGRLLEGSKALSAEYSYMNSPNYSLKLTPKHVVFVSNSVAFEIGRCSGSYPLPYMLVWEKQKNGKWQILMDSNY